MEAGTARIADAYKKRKGKTMIKTGIARLGLAAVLGAASMVANAGTLATETTDYNSTIGDPTLSVTAAGANTVTGSIGPTGTGGDGQDQFSVQIPSNLEVTSISYSGKTTDDNSNSMVLSASGCGFSSINQTLASPASSCTINFNISGDFLVSTYNWTVTVNVQVPSNSAPTASSFTAGPYEGLSHTFATSDFGYSDGDSDTISHLLIEAAPAAGTLYVDADNDDSYDAGEEVSAADQISKADLDAGHLQYIQNGSTNTSFQFEVNDGTDTSTGNYVATLNVVPIPTVTLGVSTPSQLESLGTAVNVTATLSNSYGAPVTVNLAFSGTATNTTDYTRSATAITIPAGSTSGSISLTNVDDALYENNETVITDISSVTNGTESGTQQTTYTITNDDTPPTVTLELVSSTSGPFNGNTTADIADESGGQIYVAATLSAAAGVTVSVPLAFSGTAMGGGTDYAVSSSSITLTAGQITGTSLITAVFDGIEEGNETIVVDMNAPTNATESGTQQVVATIIDEDATAPTVSSVAVPANATYVAGQNLDFTVNTSENVTVNTTGGTPRLALTLGATTRYASYHSGSGTSALLFRYTVQTGDLDADGIGIGSALEANGGTLLDTFGNAMTTTLNSVADTSAVLVDAVAPTVASVSVPADGTYATGDALVFTVNTSEAVTVNTTGGTPQLALTIGATTRQAVYQSGSGTSALVFSYTVQAGEADGNGITLGTLTANGATLRDAVGNSMNTALNSVGATGAVLVDAVAPKVTGIVLNASYGPAAGSVDYTVTFDEIASNLSVDDFKVTSPGSATGRVASVSAASGDTITVTVEAIYGSGALRLDLRSGTDIADTLSNTGTPAFSAGQSHTVSRLPSITSASYDVATGTLMVTGQNFSALPGAANDVDASLFTIAGETVTGTSGGSISANYTSPYALSATADVEITSETTFTIQVAAADQPYVSGIFTANGTVAADGTTYNLAAADNWLGAAPASLDISDTGNAISVSGALTLATTTSDTTTYTGNDGSATVTPAGGVSPYTDFIWSNGATSATANNLEAGNYRVWVTDSVGTVRSASVMIADPVNTEGQIFINGDAVVGQTLNAALVDSDVTSDTVVTFQWSQFAGPDVGTGSSYTVQSSDLGNTLIVTASYTDDIGYTETPESAPTDTVITVQQNALNVISATAESNSTPPDENDYSDAGVTEVTTQILALINRAVSRQTDSADVDETAELQALVDVILEGQDDDGDGLPNIFEGDETVDTDGDGVPNRDDTDADNDGIADVIELECITADTDDDGIADAFDADVGNDDADGTDDGKTDNNFDGVNDDVDTLSELYLQFLANEDGDQYPDSVDADADGDGITDVPGTDTDDDGIIDGEKPFADVLEALMCIDPDRDAAPNHLDLDSDNDTLTDVSEAGLPDWDGNAFKDNDNTLIIDKAALPDTDGDGVPNYLQLDSDGISFDILTGPFSGRAGTLDADNDGRLDDGTDLDGDGLADSIDGKPGFGINNDRDGDGIIDTQDLRVGTTPDIRASEPVIGGVWAWFLAGLLMLSTRRRRAGRH